MHSAGHAIISERDSVDRLLADWRRHDPTLPVGRVAIAQRLSRLMPLMGARIEANLQQRGLSSSSFAVLSVLERHTGEPLAQRDLARRVGLTAGTISTRVSQLAEDGLVERLEDPDDARTVRLRITEAGTATFYEAAPSHLRTLEELLGSLTDEQQRVLSDLLRRLLLGLERDEHVVAVLGAALAPVPVALEVQRRSGRTPRAGLLVTGVEPDGPAAGVLRPGDVLVEADGAPLRSVVELGPTTRRLVAVDASDEERTVTLDR